MKLYDYFRSSASYRVRIALNIKQLEYEQVEVHLTKDGGQQHQRDYLAINPQGLVPCLEIDNQYINESLAIIEFLEEKFPEIPLLPYDAYAKATVRSLALMVACDMHPINNLRVLNYLKENFHAGDSQIKTWYQHWLKKGFDAFETKLRGINRGKDVCVGNVISMADVCLIPQVYNAHRFELPMDKYPLINAINDYCMSLEAFKKAAPE